MRDVPTGVLVRLLVEHRATSGGRSGVTRYLASFYEYILRT